MQKIELKAVLFIARRLLRGNKRLILPAAAGIFVTVAACIIAMALLRGFEEELTASLTRTGPHIAVTAADGGALYRPEQYLNALNVVPGVRLATPVLITQALLKNDDLLAGAEIIGVNPHAEGIMELAPNLQGRWLDDGFCILPGQRLAESLQVKEGSVITMTALDDSDYFEVAGIFRSGAWEVDSSVAIIPLEINQLLYRQENWAQEIWLRLDNPAESEAIGERIQKDTGLRAVSWLQRQAGIASAMRLQRRAAAALLLLMTAVASVGVMATIRILILGRMQALGILMALGMKSREIILALVFMTGLYSTLAALSGAALALLSARILQTMRPELPGEFYNISFLPVRAWVGDFIVIPLIVVVFAITASFWPTAGLSRLNPSDILRGE